MTNRNFFWLGQLLLLAFLSLGPLTFAATTVSESAMRDLLEKANSEFIWPQGMEALIDQLGVPAEAAPAESPSQVWSPGAWQAFLSALWAPEGSRTDIDSDVAFHLLKRVGNYPVEFIATLLRIAAQVDGASERYLPGYKFWNVHFFDREAQIGLRLKLAALKVIRDPHLYSELFRELENYLFVESVLQPEKFSDSQVRAVRFFLWLYAAATSGNRRPTKEADLIQLAEWTAQDKEGPPNRFSLAARSEVRLNSSEFPPADSFLQIVVAAFNGGFDPSRVVFGDASASNLAYFTQHGELVRKASGPAKDQLKGRWGSQLGDLSCIDLLK